MWYEAIFGADMWNHVIIQTNFWGHRKFEAEKRKKNRKMDEEKLKKLLIEELKRSTISVPPGKNVHKNSLEYLQNYQKIIVLTYFERAFIMN